MNWYDKFLFPTKEGAAGKLLESRLIESVEKINKDKTLDFVVVLGDYSEGSPCKSFDILKGILAPLKIIRGNHDPKEFTYGDLKTVSDVSLHRICNFIFLETVADEKTRGYFSRITEKTQDFLKEEIRNASAQKTKLSIIFTHSPIFFRIIGSNPKKIISKEQGDMKVVNIAGHIHRFSQRMLKNGMIEQIVLDALFCYPHVYKFTVADTDLKLELM